MRKILSPLIAMMLTAGAAHASSITFVGSDAFGREAEVIFETLAGNQLKVTLTNTSDADVLVPTDVLTAVFFDLSATFISKDSALLNTGSTVFYDADGQPAGGVVGGEWAYKANLVGANGGGTKGISSTGLGLFGPGDRFPGNDLAPPASPDGVQYGLLSAGDNPLTDNGGISGSGGLIQNSVVFLLTANAAIDLATISKVEFQYGTALNEPSIPGTEKVPDGGTTLSLLGGALLGLGMLRRKFKV